jgi:hypothetical protein
LRRRRFWRLCYPVRLLRHVAPLTSHRAVSSLGLIQADQHPVRITRSHVNAASTSSIAATKALLAFGGDVGDLLNNEPFNLPDVLIECQQRYQTGIHLQLFMGKAVRR